MIIREALAEGSAALAAAGIDTPGLDAALLLANVLNINRSSLIAASPRPLAGEAFAAYHDVLRRRMAGECTAYILGRKEFYGLNFRVNPSVLVPRPDTEILVETAMGMMKEWGTENREQRPKAGRLAGRQPIRVIELCTGSGAVAVALKHTMPELEVIAADISAEALEVAQANAECLLPPDSIYFCRGDLYDALPMDRKYHSQVSVIISNPPYVPTAEIAGLSPEVRREPMLALDGGSGGLEIISRIISGAPDFLCSGGILLLEADPRQMRHITVLLQQTGFADIQTHKDLSGKERVIGGRKGS